MNGLGLHKNEAFDRTRLGEARFPVFEECVCVHVWFHQSVSVCTLVYWTMSSGVLCEEDCTWAKGAGVQTWVKEPAQSPINHSMLHPSLTAYWARTDRGDVLQKHTRTPFIPPSVSSPQKQRQSWALFEKWPKKQAFNVIPTLCLIICIIRLSQVEFRGKLNHKAIKSRV